MGMDSNVVANSASASRCAACARSQSVWSVKVTTVPPRTGVVAISTVRTSPPLHVTSTCRGAVSRGSAV